MPDELWRMTEFILTRGKDCAGLFLERGDDVLCREIRECLDTAKEFPMEVTIAKEGENEDDEEEVSVLSMAETLLRFLEALPESVIPSSSYDKVMRISELNGSIMQVSSQIECYH